MRNVIFERSAQREFLRLPTNVRGLLLAKIDQLAEDPESLRNNVTKLVGVTGSRLRVGDWRVIFRADGDTLLVTRIAPRGSAYD